MLSMTALLISCVEREITNPVDTRYSLTAPVLDGASIDEDNQVKLNWSNRDGNPQYFQIHRKLSEETFEALEVVQGNEYNYVDHAFDDTVKYTYAVMADWYGKTSVFSNVLDVQMKDPFLRYYPGVEAVSWGMKVIITTDGGYLYSRQDIIENHPHRQSWLIKTDRYGNQEWGGTIPGEARAVNSNILQSQDGGFLVFAGGYLLQYDGSGEREWKREMSDLTFARIVENIDSDIFIYGMRNNPGSGNELVLTKRNNKGSKLWEKIYFEEEFRDVANLTRTADGNLIIGCVVTTLSNVDDYYTRIKKIDSDGRLLWSRDIKERTYLDHFSNNQSTCLSMTSSPDGGAVVLMNFGSYGSYALKYSAEGDVEWHQFLSRGYGIQVIGTHDNGFMVLMTYGDNWGSKAYFRLTKLDNLGQVSWTQAYSEAASAIAREVVQAGDGGYAVVGTEFDKVGARYTAETFLLKLDESGNHAE